MAPARLATSYRLLGRAYHLRASAYWKHDSAKPRIDSSVLYIPMATPAPAAQAVQVVAVQGSVAEVSSGTGAGLVGWARGGRIAAKHPTPPQQYAAISKAHP